MNRHVNRKYRIAIISLALIAGYGVFAAFRESAQAVYPAFIGGILAAAGIYGGANVIQKAVTKEPK